MKHNLPSGIKVFFLAAFCFVITFQSTAQSIRRETVASIGSYSFGDNDKILVRQTIGQPYATKPVHGNNFFYNSGFQQTFMKLESIDSDMKLIKLNVFPNPATYSVVIESNEALKDALILVTDMSGQIILKQTVAELKSFQINCSSWTSGIYCINLSDKENHRYSSKLIITK